MGPALPIIAIAATVAGAGLSAYSSIQQGNAASAQAKYQAGIAQMNARQADQNQTLANRNAAYIEQGGARDTDDKAREIRSVMGAQRAAMAANGLVVDSGTNADLQGDTARLGNMTIGRIQEGASRGAYGQRIQGYNAGVDAAMARTRANAYEASGRSARTAGFLGAASSLLGGASSAGNQYADMTRSGVKMPSIPFIS